MAAARLVVLTLALRRSLAHSVTARVWRPSMAGFVYPEMDPRVSKPFADLIGAKEDLGFAFAGGGLRGAYIAHGAVRTLRSAGMLERARYMSVTSGSVWFGVPLQFQTQDSLDAFLGEAVPPRDCTPRNLTSARAGTYVTRMRWPIRRFPAGMAPQEASAVAAPPGARHRRDFEVLHGLESGLLDRLLHCFEHLCSCIVDGLIPEGSLHESWVLLSSYVASAPFGLASPGSSYCHAADADMARSKWGGRGTLYATQDVQHGLPYMLSQAAVLDLNASLGQHGSPLVAYPLEYTPMYSGVPVAYVKGKNGTLDRSIGDLLVEPIGFNSEALEPVPNASFGEVGVRPRRNAVNVGDLAEWEGAASSYVADYQIRPWHTKIPRCGVTAGEKLMPHSWMWSPLHADSRGVPIPRDTPLADSGVYDDLGHLPLLRRRVKKIVIYDSSAIHDNMSGVQAPNLEEMVYLLAAFGQPSKLVPPNPAGSPNPYSPVNFLRVFEPSEFGKLWARMGELHAASEPVVVRDTFTVVDNPWFGVVGGWQVEIVWVIGTPIDAWRRELPPETRAHLPTWFPNVISSEPSNQFELSALSQYSSWVTERAVLGEVRAMLRGGGEGPAAARVIV